LEANAIFLPSCDQAKASELLGISRTTLRAKLRTLGMTIEKQISQESAAGPT